MQDRRPAVARRALAGKLQPGALVVALVAALATAGAQEATTPVWSTPDRCWFRVPVPGGSEWWTVDARNGARERLFDHRRLAPELSEHSKRTYTPLTLPFADPASAFIVKYDGSNAALQEGALAIEFSLDDERWRCELQGEWDWGRTPPGDDLCASTEEPATQAPPGAGPVRSPDGKITWYWFDGRAIPGRSAGTVCTQMHGDRRLQEEASRT